MPPFAVTTLRLPLLLALLAVLLAGAMTPASAPAADRPATPSAKATSGATAKGKARSKSRKAAKKRATSRKRAVKRRKTAKRVCRTTRGKRRVCTASRRRSARPKRRVPASRGVSLPAGAPAAAAPGPGPAAPAPAPPVGASPAAAPQAPAPARPCDPAPSRWLGVFALDDNGVFLFRLSRVCVPAGPLSIDFQNRDLQPHNVWAEGVQPGAARRRVVDDVDGEQSGVGSTVLAPGQWRLYCDVLGHESMSVVITAVG
jgi:plastocyanin